MKKTKLTRSLLAACSIVALTAVMYGCVHSSDDPPATDDTGVDMPDPAIAERTAITNAINAARTAVGMVNDTSSDATVTAANTAIAAARTAITNATNVPAEERTAHTGTVNAIASTLATALASRTDAMDEAAEEAAEAALALFNGIGDATNLPVAVTAVGDEDGGGGMAEVTATGLTPGVGGDDVMSSAEPMLGMWQGTRLTDSVPATPATATNAGTSSTVVVYTDIGPAESVPFGDVYDLDAAGNLAIVAAADANPHVALISASAFTHAGRVNHDPDPDATDDVARIRGTFNGAAGEYRCTAASATACGSIESSAGVRLAGTWVFDPDSGAMATMQDPSFAYFGWWLNSGTTEGVEAGVFHGVTDGTGDDALLGAPTDIAALGGTATYNGAAAGQYAINPGLSDAHGGHWTADATLTADFGSETENGSISGMVDNFMAGGRAMDWTVALGETNFTDGTAVFASAGDGTTTADDDVVWTVGGVAGAESGSWSGGLRGAGDNGVPTVATGMFTAMHGTVGHIMGAFGAHVEE